VDTDMDMGVNALELVEGVPEYVLSCQTYEGKLQRHQIRGCLSV